MLIRLDANKIKQSEKQNSLQKKYKKNTSTYNSEYRKISNRIWICCQLYEQKTIKYQHLKRKIELKAACSSVFNLLNKKKGGWDKLNVSECR